VAAPPVASPVEPEFDASVLPDVPPSPPVLVFADEALASPPAPPVDVEVDVAAPPAPLFVVSPSH
jgi:hypothetical protein